MASQVGNPKPAFETLDGDPIFPQDEDDAWWLTDVSKRVAAENVKGDEDGPATDEEEVEEERKDVSDDDPLSEVENVGASSSQHVPTVAWPNKKK